ncbi:Xanthosine phosphorylase [Klebsiella quasipneumoniae]|uniref:hypothetical protein n=1 Tax=Klebsiella TaxID=570 RepID=UPI0010ED2845|nr:Xanthosine phosphorylase [Klebsiella quasipneumoniae]
MSHFITNDTPYKAVEILNAAKPGFKPRIAFILGSGLGVQADKLDNKTVISYEKLPGFPVSTVIGHAGEVVIPPVPAVLALAGSAEDAVYRDG